MASIIQELIKCVAILQICPDPAAKLPEEGLGKRVVLQKLMTKIRDGKEDEKSVKNSFSDEDEKGSQVASLQDLEKDEVEIDEDD